MLRIPIAPGPPPVLPQFSLRSRREQPVRDLFNARQYQHWNEDQPTPQTNGPDASRGAAYNDMNPTNTRTVERDQRQAQPQDVNATGEFQKNPQFQKFDVTLDPRNVARELQGAVYEQNPPRDMTTSNRLLSRNFENRQVPSAEVGKSQEQAIDVISQFRPKLNDMKATYRHDWPSS